MRSSRTPLKNSRRLSAVSATALLVATLLTGCGAAVSSTATGTSLGSSASADSSSKGSSLSSDATAGNLQIMASADSSPSDLADITLGVSSIDLHVQGGDFVNIYNQTTSLDISALLNGAMSTVTQATVAAGTYDQIRVTFASASATFQDGTTVSIDDTATSSSSSSSSRSQNIFVVPLKVPVAITADAVSHLLIDFRSGQMQPPPRQPHGSIPSNSPDCGLVPPMRLANLDTAGSVSGTVTSTSNDTATDVSGVFVIASVHGKVAGTAVTDSGGNYEIIGLDAGSYDINVLAKGYQPKEFRQIAIAIDANTSQDVDLIAGSSGPQGGNPPPPPEQQP